MVTRLVVAQEITDSNSVGHPNLGRRLSGYKLGPSFNRRTLALQAGDESAILFGSTNAVEVFAAA